MGKCDVEICSHRLNAAWYRGRLYQQDGPLGIFPANHITVKEHTTFAKS